jgi:hypothetical protein
MTEMTPRALRTPRAAGLAGIVFAALFGTYLGLIHGAAVSSNGTGGWLTNASSRREIQFALGLVPFCGIAFLWFIGAVRSRVGEAEDKFLATVFLGSGLLFVGMLFVSSAVFGALVTVAEAHRGSVSPESWVFGRTTMLNLSSVYALRMAAVFAMSTSTIALRLHIFSKVVIGLGYGSALLLLFASPTNVFIHFLFPAWVLIVSVNIVVLTFRREAMGNASSPSPSPSEG